MPQETVLFSGTVRDNIRYGRPDASDEEVIAAAKAAQAHDFILELPQGYDTHVEERGVNLSGGQKQRIAIARALLTQPKILILDDSTSSVDVETETKIQDALEEMMHDRTSFVVAQRISTVLKADKIIVIDKGRIAAEGTHAELMQTSPIYQEIYDSQLGNGFKLKMAHARRSRTEEVSNVMTIPASRDERPRMSIGVPRAGGGRPCSARSKKPHDPRQALVRLLPYLNPFKVALGGRAGLRGHLHPAGTGRART